MFLSTNKQQAVMRYATLILVLGSTSFSVNGQSASPTRSSAIETVQFCELLKNPQMYHQKVVRIRAVFSRGGEEWSAIFCPNCSTDKTLIGPRFEDSFESDTPSRVARRFAKRWDVTLAVILVGRFDTSGGGHLGMHPYLFHIIRAERADLISKHSLQPWGMSEKQKRNARCRGKHNKSLDASGGA